jgi:hypothetical protein
VPSRAATPRPAAMNIISRRGGPKGGPSGRWLGCFTGPMLLLVLSLVLVAAVFGNYYAWARGSGCDKLVAEARAVRAVAPGRGGR